MIKLDQINLPIKYSNLNIEKEICKKLNVKNLDIQNYEILKLSIDARKKPNIKYIATIGVNLKNGLEEKFENLKFEKNTRFMVYCRELYGTCNDDNSL